jgi:formylglycine-generating enzyme required for sulfatase activity
MNKKNCVLLILIFIKSLAFSNNIQVSNLSLVGQNTTDKFKMIKFNLSWENSWRTSTLESNWDAAWVFVKYRKLNEFDWSHCYLNNTGHLSPAGTEIQPGLVNTALPFNKADNPAVGAFIHRSADGIGDIDFTNIQLRWNYDINGLGDQDSVEVCVFAIEMVYIPQNSFYVGDNNLLNQSTSAARMRRGDADLPYLITSENAITIGNNNASELWGGIGSPGTLPADFPKGYAGFYIMKHELTQGIYKEYLNKLSRVQQNTRVQSTALNHYVITGNHATPTARNGIKLIEDPGDPLPRVYANDLNNNNIHNEVNDGQHLPVNAIAPIDAMAFADWSGLRPLTELEYEKACRGTLDTTPNEFAWGNNNFTSVNAIANAGTGNEVSTTPNANTLLNNTFNQGPIRVGNFANNASNRFQAGASYYGVLDLTGNQWEPYVSVTWVATRSFKGNPHGNGLLLPNGNHDVSGWVSSMGLRGGGYNTNSPLNNATISSRTEASQNYNSQRLVTIGVRLGRTH